MAEASPFQDPFESTEEEINPPDEDEYLKKLKLALAKDPEVGVEVAGKMRALDLRRIIRAYLEEKDRWGETLSHAKMWALEAVKPKMLESWKKPLDEDLQNVGQHMPMFYFGQDKQGHPICYEKVCDYKITEMQKLPVELLRTYRDRLTTSAYELNKRQTESRGKPIYKKIVVIDAKGLGVLSAKPFYDVVSKVTSRESDLWAETVYKIYVINTGYFFSALWTMFKGLAHPRTQRKFNLCGADYKAKLLEEIDENMIPQEYGGTAEQPVVVGGWWFPTDNLAVAVENAPAEINVSADLAEDLALLDELEEEE